MEEGIGDIAERTDTAFKVALGKLLDTNGKLETVMQTGEAFGRGLFADCIKEKPVQWTMEEWLDVMVENVFDPLGTAFKFSNITSDEVQSFLVKSPLQEKINEPQVASLFTYGFMRGLLLSAFPSGEILMESTIQEEEQPMTKFVFKKKASYTDKGERERVKSSFDVTKKL